MEAYRYPEDYNGISSMAPANPMVALMVSSLWTGAATLKDPASQIPREKFTLIHKAAIQACDAADGVRDGIISAPADCHFDPAVLQCKTGAGPDCLTSAQVAALRAIYQGPRNPRTGASLFPGFEPGSEAQIPLQTVGPEPFGVALTFLRDLVFADPKWSWRSFAIREQHPRRPTRRPRLILQRGPQAPPLAWVGGRAHSAAEHGQFLHEARSAPRR
jgi:hypothetical protein